MRGGGKVTDPTYVGLYRELYPDFSAGKLYPSIKDAISDTAQEHEPEIIAYLRSAVCLGARGGYVNDVLDPSYKEGLPAHTYTDGTYMWRLDLAYYVGKYHLRLPEEFVRHMAARGWRPPTEEEVNSHL
jgi:hypothetical protein